MYAFRKKISLLAGDAGLKSSKAGWDPADFITGAAELVVKPSEE